MAEHDAFELRLGRALNRYVEGLAVVADAVELTESIAAAHEGRWRLGAWRLRAPGLPWTPRAVQVAWLILLAGLLAVMAIGLALVVGSQHPALGFACPPGSTPDEPGPVDQARPADHVSKKIVFDRRAGRLVAVMGSADGTAPATWTFDVCTNTWTQMHPDREPPEFISGQLVYDVDSDVTISVVAGKVWAYDLKANTWTAKGVAPPETLLGAYDPVSGLVVVASFGDAVGPWTYDVETDTWTQIRQANGEPCGYELFENGQFGYDASVDRMVVYRGGGWGSEQRMCLIDMRRGTWSGTPAATPPDLNTSHTSIAYDEATERTVFSDHRRLAAYDATADRWEILLEAGPGGPSLYDPMAYDPLNRRFVGLDQYLPGAVVAFDLVTREWTVLLDQDPTVAPWPRPTPAPTPQPSFTDQACRGTQLGCLP